MSDQELEPQAQQESPPGPPVPGAALVPPAASDGAAPETPLPCTQAQLRRFIKSRPYVPLHELRRRFGLNGDDDDVSGVQVNGHRIFVGLPERETGLLGELLRQGDVGYELLLDPTSPIVIGVFPMRPVQRP
ncbi:MAG: hypothetical protein V2B17_06385 [Chloroflexota bacterium]